MSPRASPWLHRNLDLSGQHRLIRDAAETGLDVAEAHKLLQQNQRASEISQYFYQLIFQQRQQRYSGHWSVKFSRVEEAMKKRGAAVECLVTTPPPDQPGESDAAFFATSACGAA